MSNFSIKNFENAPDLEFDEDDRRDLAKEVISVFKAWKLSITEQSMLLGIEETMITRLSHEQSLPQNYDLLWRAGNLLAIFYLLRSYNINNPDKADRWITEPNEALNGARPVDIMKSPDGIGSIRAWLESHG